MFPRAETKAFELLCKGKILTKYELAKAVPCHLMVAHRALKKLREERGNVRIVSWVRINHQPIPAYQIKRGSDAPRPD